MMNPDTTFATPEGTELRWKLKELQLASTEGKLQVIGYLINVASGTKDAEVWRALFAEMHQNLEQKMTELRK